VTDLFHTTPFLIVRCQKQIPSGLLPFTLGGQPTIFTTKETREEHYNLGTLARKRQQVVTCLKLLDNEVTDKAIQTIADEPQQLNLRPTKIGFMSGMYRLAFPHSVDSTEVPCMIAGCGVSYSILYRNNSGGSRKHPKGQEQ